MDIPPGVAGGAARARLEGRAGAAEPECLVRVRVKGDGLGGG